MDDLDAEDRGNISLPPRLQSPDLIDPNFVYDKKNFVPIINTQTAFYDAQISDMEKVIERLENRNDQLLDEQEEKKNLINSVDIETGDNIAYLKKQISVQSEKIEENVQKINDLETQRKEERENHLRIIESSNERFEDKRVILTSAIKALNAKINTLEDYKQTRIALREKLNNRDETMTRNEEMMAKKRDDIDRKFKIDREKLKNEMYTRLLALAGTFQLEISKATALPVRRLMRENIFIKSELSQIVDETLKKKENDTRIRSRKNVHCNFIKANSLDKRKNLMTIRIQRCLLKSLKKMHLRMKKRLEGLHLPEKLAQETYDELADNLSAKTSIVEARTRKLEVSLHRESVKLGCAKYMKFQLDTRAKIYDEILYDIKYALACALKMTESGQDFLDMSENQLLSYLLNCFDKGQSKIKCLKVASNESVSRPNEVYAGGDLGFEPEHIDDEPSMIQEKKSQEVFEETITLTDIPNISDAMLTTVSLEQYASKGYLKGQSTDNEDISEASDKSTITESKKSSDKEDTSEIADSLSEDEEQTKSESEEDEEN